jgi:mannose-6-phosphate isomerase-like protein (cupin superfamily)
MGVVPGFGGGAVDAFAVVADAVEATTIGDGCLRRDLPAPPGARAWLIEMAPGSVWPRFDRHDTGEAYFVLDGEVIEGEMRYPAGTQVVFPPGSRHRPRSETGARLFGFHLAAEAYLGAGGDPDAIVGQLHVQQG